ncbi:MAG TPA: PPK2 family polyphosphate kinase [Bdellovibrio sp.]|uniref:PPK2 family polyphosphate kinase n=1 Tax=Bdellovibrio sp. TaxID=28201 RepID=UPI002EE1B0D0
MPKEKNFYLGKKHLSAFSTKGENFCKLNKDHLDFEINLLGERLSTLQEMIFAERKHKVLIILQGMDTSGKDSTVKHVFSATNPQGIRVVSFKAPTEEEKSKDYLWRIHKETPSHGEFVIFNRSHYEDYIVPTVHKTFPHKQVQSRLDDILAFESMLIREGVTIFKFFLHISRKEQAKRLLERLDNQKKHWKFSLSDLTEREYWDEYHEAYTKAFRYTHQSEAPWDIIPGDDKRIRDYLIVKILVDRLEKLKPDFPDIDPKIIKKAKAEADRLLK